MKKDIIKIIDDGEIIEAEVVEDKNFYGGYKVIYKNIISSINIVTIVK